MMRPSFFFQAEDGIRDLVRSRGLGDVYKRQPFDVGTMRRLIVSGDCLNLPNEKRTSVFSVAFALSLIHI